MTRLQLEITIGLLLVLVASAVLVVYGFLEEDRMAERGAEVRGESIEQGADLFETNCAPCHGAQGKGIAGVAPPLTDAEFFTNRMAEVGWNGTLEDYISSTIASGRRVSTRPELYVGAGVPAMPAWAQDFGGPLRPDQISNLANYIMSWEETALAGEEIAVLATPTPVAIDPATRGQAVYVTAGCGACHVIDGVSAGQVGPSLNEIGTIAATRIEGYSAEEYITESIVEPNAYLVEGFQPNLMPQTFGVQLSGMELEDLVAYLLEQQ